jgi:WD40 repeat protein
MQQEGELVSVGCVALSPCARFVASGADSGAVRLFDSGTGALIGVGTHRRRVTALCFVGGASDSDSDSDSGKCDATGAVLCLVSASEDGTARVWRVADNRITLLRHQGASVTCVCEVCGFVAATGAADGVVRLWDVQGSGQPLQTMNTMTDGAACACVCAWGKGLHCVAAGFDDGAFVVWRVGDGVAIHDDQKVTSRAQCDRIEAIAFSDSRGVGVSVSADGSAVVRRFVEYRTRM